MKYDSEWFEYGISVSTKKEKSILTKLTNFVLNDGTLDGDKMQNSWFPQAETDIFISHSHQDEKLAIALSGWLEKNMGLSSFVDSTVWNCSNNILKTIDNEYCLNEGKKSYSYHKRNQSTSHIHMMLSTALTMMIDNSECLFFLNTPNSISANNIGESTFSPWIFYEIAMTNLIRTKRPTRLTNRRVESFSKGGILKEELKIKYDLQMKRLQKIDLGILNSWNENCSNHNHPLDYLYKFHELDNEHFPKID